MYPQYGPKTNCGGVARPDAAVHYKTILRVNVKVSLMSDYHQVLLFLDKTTANSSNMITAPSVVESRKRAVGPN